MLGFIALRPYVEDRLYSAAGLPGCKPHRQRVGAFYHMVVGHDMAGPIPARTAAALDLSLLPAKLPECIAADLAHHLHH